MRSSSAFCAAIVCLACACSGPSATSPDEAKQPATGKLVGVHYMEPGAPDPLTCTVDADCVASTVVLAAGPCCPVPNPYAQTVAWNDWIQKRRNEIDCKSVKCPDQARPAPPRTCAMKVTCVASKCRDACR